MAASVPTPAPPRAGCEVKVFDATESGATKQYATYTGPASGRYWHAPASGQPASWRHFPPTALLPPHTFPTPDTKGPAAKIPAALRLSRVARQR